MAVMWPRILPNWVVQDPRRRAEQKVFEQLALVLNDEWSVYYSRPWWGITKTGAEVDGEADFVVAHPTHGVLFLEVKGGLVEHEPKTAVWTSKDRHGVRHKIKDPMQQAMKAKHGLLAKMQRSADWPNYRVRLRHGVVFPDCDSGSVATVAGYDRELFCLSTELRDRFTAVETTPEEMANAALRCIQDLIYQQQLPAGEIALLVPDTEVRDFLRSKLLTARLKATDAVNRRPGAIVVETVARFKGLEAAAVVVMADRLTANNNELSYVATSRARALLLVVGPVHRTILGDAVSLDARSSE